MLTISQIDSTPEVVSYYAHLAEVEQHHFDYYADDGSRPGIWWGSGCEALGLRGEVTPEAFQNLLLGLSPGGKRELVQLRYGASVKRRAGFDLTFSDVKSFSALWALADTEHKRKLDAISEKALYRVLEVVQEYCGLTRRGKDGHLQEDAKLVGAIFHHDTARNLPGEAPDPAKHHHVILCNVVVRPDGTTGALDARMIFTRRMKMALGALYRAEMSMLLEQELGIVTYRPKREHKDELASWYEIQDVPPELMKAMSKRRAQIEKYMREHGLSGAKAAEKAALRTRKIKDKFTWRELSEAWEKLGSEHEFTREQAAKLFGRLQETKIYKTSVSENVVSKAIAELVKHKARFSRNEIVERTAVESQARGIGIEDILSAVDKALMNKQQLVRLQDEKGIRTFTTPEMLALEKRMLKRAEKLHYRGGGKVTLNAVNRLVTADYPTLRPDQVNAVRAIATGGDIVSIVGIAGSGKTYMLEAARKVIESAGYKLLGTSLASKASKALERESGIKSLHIHKLIYEIQRGRIQLDKNTLLVIEEAGMVGTRHMEMLLQLVEENYAKAVLVGDYRQLAAIDAGSPLRIICEQIGSTEMPVVVRQLKKWSRDLVKDLRDGESEKALGELFDRGHLIIREDHEAAIEALVVDWCELVFEHGESVSDTLVFAGQNIDVREINHRIQAELLLHGQLGEYAVEANGYEFRLGDQVMITRNNNQLGLRNGTMAEVVGADEQKLWILTEDGLEMCVNTEVFTDISLAYAMSLFKGQGVTSKNALTLTDNVMIDREFSYVGGSRHRELVKFYADELSIGDIQCLADRMKVSRQQEMAMEHQLEVES